MSTANFLADGYTQPGYLQAAPRLHDALRFRFRPVLVAERTRLSDAALTATACGYLRQVSALLAEKLVDWDLRDPQGRDVEISPANLLRLQPELFLKLQQVVLGVTGGDADPRWPDEAVNRLAEEELAAAAAGQTIGEARQQESEKKLTLGVRLLVLHPQILGQSCDACRRWLFDENHRRLLRGGKPVARPQGVPTPCHACPKQNPTLGRRLERELARVSQAVNRYFEVRASFGQCLSPAERGDALAARNLAIVDRVVRQLEAAPTATHGARSFPTFRRN